MTKYQKYFLEMINDRNEQFKHFKEIHDKYMQDPVIYQDEFNREGKLVVEIIREWERKLCSHSEKGQYGKYSQSLADKFWQEVRKNFPKIDFVGVRIR